MTERGLPIVGGAPACPFVAFEDDRDERAASPDHRHRCYAEAQPAPRALAHQEAYCLSSAFPVCPTFQDWARREAARAREADLPPAEGADDDEGVPLLVDDRPPRRGSRDVWAAPPPWLGSAGPGGGRSPAGPTAHGEQGEPRVPGAAAGGSVGGAVGGAAAGLSGSFADRVVSDQPPARPAPGAAIEDDRAADLEEASDSDEARSQPRPRHRERLEAGSDRIETDRERDGAAPSWERPRRLEAYPTLRSQRFSSAVLPSVVLGLIALLLAAGALFFLPQLLGIGGPPAVSSPTPSPAATEAPSGETAGPSEVPAATPFIYFVKQGDTFTKIATKFGVSLDALIAANRATHPDPNLLKVGETVIIPVAVPSELPAASVAPSSAP